MFISRIVERRCTLDSERELSSDDLDPSNEPGQERLVGLCRRLGYEDIRDLSDSLLGKELRTIQKTSLVRIWPNRRTANGLTLVARTLDDGR